MKSGEVHNNALRLARARVILSGAQRNEELALSLPKGWQFGNRHREIYLPT